MDKQHKGGVRIRLSAAEASTLAASSYDLGELDGDDLALLQQDLSDIFTNSGDTITKCKVQLRVDEHNRLRAIHVTFKGPSMARAIRTMVRSRLRNVITTLAARTPSTGGW